VTVSLPPPIVETFHFLERSDAPKVGELLVLALDVPRMPIQFAAADALIHRHALHGHLELFARLDRLPAEVVRLVHQSGPALDAAFRQALSKGDLQTRQSTLRAVRLSEQYGQAGTLLDLLTRPSLLDLDDIAETLKHLVNRLYDWWQASIDRPPDAAAVQPVRMQFLSALDGALAELSKQARPDDVIDAVLILGDAGHPAVKRVLWNGPNDQRERVAGRMLDSRHPGILRLVAESLDQSYPHPKVFDAVRHRNDPEFIAALLRWFARQRTHKQHHLKQFDAIAWLEPPFELLDSIPPALQPALAGFVNATHLPFEIKTAVQEWLLRHGTPIGKQAATDSLPLVDEEVIQDVVREGLESEDAEVQAWATHQLRPHAIPEAFALLIERLDSPLVSVRDAAREELAGFHAMRVLTLSREMSPDEALRAGQLLIKIDLQAPTTVRRELAHPSRQRRLKTAAAVQKLGLASLFTSAFVAMTDDTDPIVRRCGAEVLATIPQPEAKRALRRLLDDASPRVRDVAAAALTTWKQIAQVAHHEPY
jgi:hypothetical protein